MNHFVLLRICFSESGYNFFIFQESLMSQDENYDQGDSVIDVLAVVAIVLLPVVAVVFYLSGLPG